MVVLTKLLRFAARKKLPAGTFPSRESFIDSVTLHVKGGGGGMGFPKVGGTGGKGGDVYLIAKKGITMRTVSEAWPKREVRAETGSNSREWKVLAKSGEDKCIIVPTGTSISDQYGRFIGDLDEDGSTLLVARGGEGGSSTSQYRGGPGQTQSVRLELKRVADVGLIGFPGCGKTSLFQAVSFTERQFAEREPPKPSSKLNLRYLHYHDLRQISLADLPSIQEGAHAVNGNGHKALRHLLRTRLLIFVVDITGYQLSPHHPHRSCVESLFLLAKEMELYNDELLTKPFLLVVNKCDLPGGEELFEDFKLKLKNIKAMADEIPEQFRPKQLPNIDKIFGLSALSRDQSMLQFKKAIRQFLDDYYEFKARPPMAIAAPR